MLELLIAATSASGVFILRYDRQADVLYVSKDEPAPSYVVEDDDTGLVWRTRFDDDTLSGVTVMGFRQMWAPRVLELLQIVSERFGIAQTIADSSADTVVHNSGDSHASA